MKPGRRAAGDLLLRIPRTVVLALLALLVISPGAVAAGPGITRLVVVLYPNESDGAPGITLVNRALRATFANQAPGTIEVRNEYVDTSRSRDADFMQTQVSLLRQKYAGRKVDLVIAGLSSALDFALDYRAELFPEVPVVFVAIDQREVKARRLPPDVIGVPIKMDLAATLDLALRLHPDTQRVFVIAGAAKFDLFWEVEARQTFRPYEDRLEFVYLTGMPMADLLKQVARLPERSIVYYLHVFRDGAGKTHVPADVVELLATTANAPVYGHVDTYVGRGVVGGHVFSFEREGKNAARLALRILAGEPPESIPVPAVSQNTDMFDWRQLRRWGIREDSLPRGSVVSAKEQNFWDLYKWHILGVISLCVLEALLIVGLLVQMASRRRAIDGLRQSQHELRVLTGRLLQAQETERRRIARELHDDLSQSLALLSVELDMLSQKPPESAVHFGGRVQELSARVKQLSTSVHDLSHHLHPSKLEQLGLLAAVRALCRELTHGHDLPIEFTHQEVPEAIPEDTALCLYRIVQEALQNVIKHSRAQHAEVNLRGSAGTIGLQIVDDGDGFDPTLVGGQGRLGLVSMRERLRLVRGEITIDSQRSAGTRIEVRVPLGVPAPRPDRKVL